MCPLTIKEGFVLVLKRKFIIIILCAVLAFGLGMLFPDLVQADTNLKVNISDPDHPGPGTSEGNTINSVLSTPTVSSGANREFGTIRISGKPGIAVPIQVGQKIMLTLPLGTAYMKPAHWADIEKYVECPEMLDGQKNQLASQKGVPGIKLVAATPRSLTIEISSIDNTAPIMALDFIFNQENYSKIRVAPFVEKADEYMAKPDDSLSRLEFFQLISSLVERFTPVNASPAQDRSVVFEDTAGADPADLDDIRILIKSGWVQGNGGSLLRPYEYISRVEAASMLGRVYPAQGSKAMFSDSIPAWAEYDINSAFAGGLISGYADGSFKPNQLLSKGEAVILLQRCLETYSGQ